MWELLIECAAPHDVAFCIPWFGGNTLPIYWYGILASVGIFVGAYYASRHVEAEGGDPDTIWDALLWVLVAGLLGARLWYVAAEAIGGSTAYSLSRPLEILNPRGGGLNIFGGAVGGAIALFIYTRLRKGVDMWLVADAGLMGLLLGQAIGRFGNLINRELYGPPTNSPTFGILVPREDRLSEFEALPPDTRFHPTMLYEAAWLFLTFAVLYFIFRRTQPRLVRGILSGAYLILAGLGRFVVEFWRPDQPTVTFAGGLEVSISRILALLYVVVGLIILLDRTGYLKIPFIKRPLNRRQREVQYQEILAERRRRARALEREHLRAERRHQRERAQTQAEENTGNSA